jgi:hypothetical protein
MNRLDIIRHLIKKIDAKSYLEIGVFTGFVFDHISCPHKVGVDPCKNSAATIYKTSDDFFLTNSETFDVIFIDGLHHEEQVLMDINNSIKVLNTNGYIVCHDMNPDREIIQKVPRETDEWTGDCWKAWVKLRASRNDLDMMVVDTDYGCGIISRGNQKTIHTDCDLNWKNFSKHKKEWLNLVSVDEFRELL